MVDNGVGHVGQTLGHVGQRLGHVARQTRRLGVAGRALEGAGSWGDTVPLAYRSTRNPCATT